MFGLLFFDSVMLLCSYAWKDRHRYYYCKHYRKYDHADHEDSADNSDDLSKSFDSARLDKQQNTSPDGSYQSYAADYTGNCRGCSSFNDAK